MIKGDKISQLSKKVDVIIVHNIEYNKEEVETEKEMAANNMFDFGLNFGDNVMPQGNSLFSKISMLNEDKSAQDESADESAKKKRRRSNRG